MPATRRAGFRPFPLPSSTQANYRTEQVFVGSGIPVVVVSLAILAAIPAVTIQIAIARPLLTVVPIGSVAFGLLTAQLVLTPSLIGIPIGLIVIVVVEEPLSLTHQVILLRMGRRPKGDGWTDHQHTRSNDCCETHLRAPFSLSRFNARRSLEFADFGSISASKPGPWCCTAAAHVVGLAFEENLQC
jgi:hypothetical protein